MYSLKIYQIPIFCGAKTHYTHVCVLFGVRTSLSFGPFLSSAVLLLSFNFDFSISGVSFVCSSHLLPLSLAWGDFFAPSLSVAYKAKSCAVLIPPWRWMDFEVFVQCHHCIAAHLARWRWGVTIPLSVRLTPFQDSWLMQFLATRIFCRDMFPVFGEGSEKTLGHTIHWVFVVVLIYFVLDYALCNVTVSSLSKKSCCKMSLCYSVPTEL